MTELEFKGKEFVYNHHLAVPFRPLQPDADKSVGEPRLDGNLIIQGDNLHALKALLPMYAGRVDCIFIDPPYNTGSEGWCYNDNVNSPLLKEWLRGNPVGVDDGLRHDKWCAMMYPRLRLLHELLAETGSFWMTLDDNEVHRGRAMLEEIFGASNFVATICWQNKTSPANDAKYFSDDFDYIHVFAKNKLVWRPSGLARTEAQQTYYSNPDSDPRGPWNSATYTCNKSKLERPNLYYGIRNPNTDEDVWPSETAVWRFSEDTHQRKEADGLLYWGVGGRARMPRLKLFPTSDSVVPRTVWSYKQAGHTQGAMTALSDLVGSTPFQTPKPVQLLQRILNIAATKPDAIVLDSFAGSGTTAHAVLAQNAKDGGNRKFILVECEDYADTLTAERVRRVINGYEFTGTQREELLREKITWSAFSRDNTRQKILDQVESFENLDASRFDAIKKTIKDGELVVTGEKRITECVDGLGGSFTYCTLGPPIELDKLLSGKSLPSFEALASVLFHMATNAPFDASAMSMTDAGIGLLGESAGMCVWLIYKPDLDWLKSKDAALTLERARQFSNEHRDKRHLVFAPARFVSQKLLDEKGLKVEFAPLPYALYKIERA